RVELRLLVHEGVAGGAVVAAGRREHEAPDPRLPGEARQAHRCQVVDLVGEPHVEVAQGIVREGGEMHDGVEAFEVGGPDGTHVLLEGADRLRPGPEGRSPVEVGVEADDLVAGPDQEGRHDGPDVAPAAGEEDPHAGPVTSRTDTRTIWDQHAATFTGISVARAGPALTCGRAR